MIIRRLLICGACCLMFQAHAAELNKDDGAIVKKSSSGICHTVASRYYQTLKHFTPYESVAACLQSGGQLPEAMKGN